MVENSEDTSINNVNKTNFWRVEPRWLPSLFRVGGLSASILLPFLFLSSHSQDSVVNRWLALARDSSCSYCVFRGNNILSGSPVDRTGEALNLPVAEV